MSLIDDIKKLRNLTGAGLVDCKKALLESGNDMEKAKELIRKRGQAIAAKREDRAAAEGVALGKADGDFAAIVALKCETDFVASNEKFVALTKSILDVAVANKVKSLDELKETNMDGKTVAEQITALSGITGEKMELGGYEFLSAPSVSVYNHFNKKLSVLVAFNKVGDAEVEKEIAMQVATSNPIAATREQISKETIDQEYQVAVDKTKAEQVEKAVANALKKAGFNPYYCATEEHQDEAIRKGYMTEEQVAEAKKIMADTAEQKLASMPAQMIEKIAEGRINKFYQQNVLMEQPYEADTTNKMTIAEFLAKSDKELKAIDFKRVNLNVD
ncbi:MAG: elongation factor Ts [Muribaculaceae bacterium]|nr:elongation factor Ts [Muribaculaceae bacterium]